MATTSGIESETVLLTPPWSESHCGDSCQDSMDWVGGSRVRSALYPPISAAGKAQRRRRGEIEGERKTVRKEKEEGHGHKQRL